MNLTREVLIAEKQKYLTKMLNTSKINSIFDVITINKSTRSAPSNVVKIALHDVICNDTTICDTPCKVLEIDTTKKYFKFTKPNSDNLVVYIHGGGFVNGFALQGTFIMKAMMKYFGTKCIAIDYPLSPENIYPTALEKLYDIYIELLKTYNAKNIILIGESAGSNLVISLMLRLKQNKIHLPACAVLPSGFYDLTCSNKSYDYNSYTDPSLTKLELEHMAIAYVNGDNLNVDKNKYKDPQVSPVFANLEGLPPLFFSVCKDELLYGDTITMVEKCKAQNVTYFLHESEKCFHAYMVLGEFFPESKRSTLKAVDFIASHTNIKLAYDKKTSK